MLPRPHLHRLVFPAVLLAACAAALAQSSGRPLTPPTNGPKHSDPAWHAIVHATATTEPGKTISDATIVFKDGVIVSVAEKSAPPEGARVWDATGLSVYPGLVEPYLSVDAPRPDKSAPGSHWNARITPERSVLDGPGVSADARKKLRALGYGAAVIAPSGGIMRGTAALVSLAEPGEASTPGVPGVMSRDVFHCAAFDTAGGADDAYPGAKMGVIALLRQSLIDADWSSAATAAYEKSPGTHERPPASAAMAALGAARPWLFDAGDVFDSWRFAKIIREFRARSPVISVGTGAEYQHIEALKQSGVSLIEPLAFPKAPKVTTEGDRDSVALRDLMAWEQAPTNLRRLDAASLRVAITTSKLPKDADFMSNLRDAVKAGLSEDKALAMLTTTPAELAGASGKLGKLAPGYAANIVVCKNAFFDPKREIRDVWIDGQRHEITPAPSPYAEALKGTWTATLAFAAPVEVTMKVADKTEITIEKPGAPAEAEKKPDAKPEESKPKTESTKAKSASLLENRLDFSLPASAIVKDADGTAQVRAILEEGKLRGTVTMPDGSHAPFSAVKQPAEPDKDAEKKDEKKDDKPASPAPEKFGAPFGPYAFDEPPAQKSVLIKNATVWTNGASGGAGVIKNGAVHIAAGKVRAVGAMPLTPDPKYPVDIEIDAQGRHVTPGIIDCHSHTGISGGVNEGTQSCTAEVRIFDVIEPDDINWYRQLAGGVTAVNQLHGSANAIGGQNSVVKLRWGSATPDDMRFQGAPPGIKFALGENVKQSNWGDRVNTRYPQTRMGVETFIRDRFIAAREYDAAKTRAGSDPAFHRDLELECLAEILRGERLVHCHSYRQDEILMLCRVADEFGFKIGTFQHVLEGYKVAEAIKKSAIGGSTFSDWWAYKWEVYDAIPYNGAIMASVGIPVSFNSDSDELARRLNAEAGKAVKYGHVAPAEALKFVTLNPAKQLKIDAMTGSLEVGKDADISVWSGDPLSPTTRCERTFVDGREMFSLEMDARHRSQIAAERARLIQKILAEPRKDKPAGAGSPGGSPADAPGGERRRRRETPPSTDSLTAGAVGTRFALVPAGGDDEETAQAAAAFKRKRLEAWFEFLLLNGIDPSVNRPGMCGCEF